MSGRLRHAGCVIWCDSPCAYVELQRYWHCSRQPRWLRPRREWRTPAIRTRCAATRSAARSRAGEIHSLADILKALRGKLPGEVAGVEIERKDGRWLYEFRVVDSQGRLFEVYVDARSGEIERIKEK